jgi:NAD(P)-dependent dehydrogenase (short-subunit alcohol dehydrogenase family)
MNQAQALPVDLTERVILVTGASRGIGRALALTIAEHGGTVLLLGRQQKALNAVYDAITSQGCPTPALLPFDLENALEPDYQALVDAIQSHFGRLDGLVHNAAILGERSPIRHADVATFCKVLHVNVTAAFALTHALMPLLEQSQRANIVFTSSGVGVKGRAYWGGYAISKFAIEGMAQVLADEVDPKRLVVNVINPGATRTDMRALAFPGEDPLSLRTPEAVARQYLPYLSASCDAHGTRFDCR